MMLVYINVWLIFMLTSLIIALLFPPYRGRIINLKGPSRKILRRQNDGKSNLLLRPRFDQGTKS